MMIETSGLLGLLIFIIIVAVIAAVVIWCINYFLPEFSRPGRLIVGAVALIAILIKVAAYLGVAV